MTPEKRQMVLMGLMLAMLAVAAVWAVDAMASSRRAAEADAADLAVCRDLAAELAALRKQPAVASSEAIDVQQLGDRIQAASQQAGLASQLEGVFPQSPRRMGDSPYVQKPTSLSLRGVTLGQLATFVFQLTSDGALNVRDLRLRSRTGDPDDSLWDAEATLTYLIYQPTTSRRNP
jgi:hypothetical protein